MKNKIIGIIGSRTRDDYKDWELVHNKFLEIYKDDDWICSGGCKVGGDHFAFKLHLRYFIPYLEFPANWDKHGKAAGFIRNTDIAKVSHVLIACLDKENGKGTQDTINKFIQLHGEENLYIV